MTAMSWVKLKENCIIDISRLADSAKEIEYKLEYRNSDKPEIIDEAKVKIDLLIKQFLSLLHDKELLTSDTDKKAFVRLQEDFGRILSQLDTFYEKFVDGRRKELTVDGYRRYISLLRTVFYGDIYEPLYKATVETKKHFEEIDVGGKDKRGILREQFFLYKIFEITSVNVGVFGNYSRVGGKGKFQ